MFSFDLLDAAGGEIRVTGFNATCEKFFPLIQPDAVITLSKASLKPKRQGNVRATPPARLLASNHGFLGS